MKLVWHCDTTLVEFSHSIGNKATLLSFSIPEQFLGKINKSNTVCRCQNEMKKNQTAKTSVNLPINDESSNIAFDPLH